MTDEERKEEGAEEPVEDLEAPAEEQDDVAGGKCIWNTMGGPKCPDPTELLCHRVTCTKTKAQCTQNSGRVVVYNQ